MGLLNHLNGKEETRESSCSVHQRGMLPGFPVRDREREAPVTLQWITAGDRWPWASVQGCPELTYSVAIVNPKGFRKNEKKSATMVSVTRDLEEKWQWWWRENQDDLTGGIWIKIKTEEIQENNTIKQENKWARTEASERVWDKVSNHLAWVPRWARGQGSDQVRYLWCTWSV